MGGILYCKFYVIGLECCKFILLVKNYRNAVKSAHSCSAFDGPFSVSKYIYKVFSVDRMSFEQSWQIKYFTWSSHVFLILYVHRSGQASDSVFDLSLIHI